MSYYCIKNNKKNRTFKSYIKKLLQFYDEQYEITPDCKITLDNTIKIMIEKIMLLSCSILRFKNKTQINSKDIFYAISNILQNDNNVIIIKKNYSKNIEYYKKWNNTSKKVLLEDKCGLTLSLSLINRIMRKYHSTSISMESIISLGAFCEHVILVILSECCKKLRDFSKKRINRQILIDSIKSNDFVWNLLKNLEITIIYKENKISKGFHKASFDIYVKNIQNVLRKHKMYYSKDFLSKIKEYSEYKISELFKNANLIKKRKLISVSDLKIIVKLQNNSFIECSQNFKTLVSPLLSDNSIKRLANNLKIKKECYQYIKNVYLYNILLDIINTNIFIIDNTNKNTFTIDTMRLSFHVLNINYL